MGRVMIGGALVIALLLNNEIVSLVILTVLGFAGAFYIMSRKGY